MTSAAKSVYYFGFYLLGLSVVLLVVPNFLLETFQMPTTNEIWIRVVGALVGAIGTYYVQISRTNQPEFIRLTVFVRFSILIWFVIFVLAGWAPSTLILFGLVDAAGAIWTFLALRKG